MCLLNSAYFQLETSWKPCKILYLQLHRDKCPGFSFGVHSEVFQREVPRLLHARSVKTMPPGHNGMVQGGGKTPGVYFTYELSPIRCALFGGAYVTNNQAAEVLFYLLGASLYVRLTCRLAQDERIGTAMIETWTIDVAFCYAFKSKPVFWHLCPPAFHALC